MGREFVAFLLLLFLSPSLHASLLKSSREYFPSPTLSPFPSKNTTLYTFPAPRRAKIRCLRLWEKGGGEESPGKRVIYACPSSPSPPPREAKKAAESAVRHLRFFLPPPFPPSPRKGKEGWGRIRQACLTHPSFSQVKCG